MRARSIWSKPYVLRVACLCSECGGLVPAGDAAQRNMGDFRVAHSPACPTPPRVSYEQIRWED